MRVFRFYHSSSPSSPPLPSSSSPLLLRASSRSQWATPSLPVRDGSGHCRTAIFASARSQWHCRTSTASARSQWALPDLSSTRQIAVGTAGPRQIECQNISQLEGQRICPHVRQTEPECLPSRVREFLPDRMPVMMPDKVQAVMVDRMPAMLPDRTQSMCQVECQILC